MLSQQLKENLIKDDNIIAKIPKDFFSTPLFNPLTHYKDLSDKKYFNALLVLRHYIKAASDYYFGLIVGAKNVDLFMMTSSVSSPMGPGSDSEAIKIKFGKHETFLVDSSQFGFEPLLLNGFDKVYCYLPSMRGEDCDNRHLNQFYHCELEMKGKLDDLIPIIEGYIKILCEVIILMDETINRISENPKITKEVLKNIIDIEKFPAISFDEAVDILVKNRKFELVNFTEYGRDISANGELELMRILDIKTPLWIMYYDRDRVPFYQKPDPKNKNKVINADLIFPALKEGSFGGEIVGCGQRQNNTEEMYESLKRQSNLSANAYEWYIDLRRLDKYETTSGFGLGIERFIAWSLIKKSIKDVIPYPRLKNTITLP